MSEWAEFCENMGINPGCPDDYERLLDQLAGKVPQRPTGRADDDEYQPSDRLRLEREQLRFENREEAVAWSQKHGNRAFVRSIHGPHFVPKDGVDAPRNLGGMVQRGVTVWPPKRYPRENPAASTWVPGSYPTTRAEEELSAIDRENVERTFLPRLRKLAPWLFRASRKLDLPLKRDLIVQWAGRPLTQSELFAVLTLAENRVAHYEQYFRSQEAARIRPVEQRHEPDHWMYRFIQPYNESNPPRELIFWRAAYDIVMDELVDLE